MVFDDLVLTEQLFLHLYEVQEMLSREESIETLISLREQLLERIAKAIEVIEAIKKEFPYTEKEFLDNLEAVKAKQDAIIRLIQEYGKEILRLSKLLQEVNQKMEELQKKEEGKTMNEEKKELSTRENDVLAVSFLKQNRNSVQSPFSRDIFLMNTMINGAMHVDGIHKRAAELHEGDRMQLILEPKNKYDDKAILVKNEKGDKLGYIPRIKNEVLYHLMDAGK